MVMDAVVVETNLSESGICVVVHHVGLTYLKVRSGCQISKGDVIFGPLIEVGNHNFYNETMSDGFQASILMVRPHEEN